MIEEYKTNQLKEKIDLIKQVLRKDYGSESLRVEVNHNNFSPYFIIRLSDPSLKTELNSTLQFVGDLLIRKDLSLDKLATKCRNDLLTILLDQQANQ